MCASSGARVSRRSRAAGARAAACEACSVSAAASGASASAATIPKVSYTVAQAARLAGCTASQLRHWSRSELVTASLDGGRYGFRDLVSLRVVRSLLDAGLPSARVRAAVLSLREHGDGDLAGLRLI